MKKLGRKKLRRLIPPERRTHTDVTEVYRNITGRNQVVKDTVCYAKAFDIYLKAAGTLKIFIQDSDVFELEIRTCDFSCFSKVGIDFIVFSIVPFMLSHITLVTVSQT